MIAINLKAYFACQHVAPMMAVAGGGSIINFSSISYSDGQCGLPLHDRQFWDQRDDPAWRVSLDPIGSV